MIYKPFKLLVYLVTEAYDILPVLLSVGGVGGLIYDSDKIIICGKVVRSVGYMHCHPQRNAVSQSNISQSSDFNTLPVLHLAINENDNDTNYSTFIHLTLYCSHSCFTLAMQLDQHPQHDKHVERSVHECAFIN